MPNFDTSTIIAAAVLSMFTAITLTQYLLKLLVNARIFESPSVYGATGFDPKAVNSRA